MAQKGFTPILIVLILVGLVGGYFIYQNKSTPSSQPTTIASPLDKTVGWKTYTNTKLGYSLKYPPDWKLIECPKDCDGQGQETGILSPDISSITAGYLKYYSVSMDTHKFELPIEYSKEIINNITVTRHIEPGLGEYVLFKENNKEVVLNFSPYSKEQPGRLQDKFYAIFNQILSTFKFLP